MSKAQAKNDKANYYPPRNKPKFKRGNEKGKYFYQSNFPYYNGQFNFQPPWKFFHWRKPPFRRRRNATPEREPLRPPSPFSGTEEYTLKKIQEASDMIKKQLMMPEISEANADKNIPTEPPKESDAIPNEKKNDKGENEKNAAKNNKKHEKYNVGEIHHKIIAHITNLNHGKKMNLICATSSGYDEAIQQIQRQKRLELSKALRDMCSNQTVDNSDAINSIIPDIGIKIEELPLEVIQELSSTLDLNFEETFCQNNSVDTVRIKTEVCDTDEFTTAYPIVDVDGSCIKTENDSCNESTDCPMDTNFDPNIIPKDDEMEDSNVQCNKSNSEACQTDSVVWFSMGTQTDFDHGQFEVNTNIKNLDEAVKSMLAIDKEIARLTELRQSMFTGLQNLDTKNGHKKKKPNNKATISEKKTVKGQIQRQDKKEKHLYKKELNFGDISEKILVMKVIEDTLLVGSESGKILYINLENGTTTGTIEIDFPVTSFCVWKGKKNLHFFVGSFETRIREYNFYTKSLVRLTHTGESVQCMEVAWDCIFIGTISGSLMRYSMKLFKIEFEDRISKDRILVLKATQEGARKVLLVGTKSCPVCVRDAMSGLHMRTMNGLVVPTVYSLLLEKSLVYCGTTFHDILVFSFHDGNLVRKYQASNSKGIGCMKIVGNLLYASCHNGNIYVYNVKTRQYVGQIEGPGGVILSMEIIKNIVIVGTMSYNFKSILVPEYILESHRSALKL